MQRTLRWALCSALLLAPGAGWGQGGGVPAAGAAWGDRPLFDYFLSRFAAPGAASAAETAVGGRLMWPLDGVAGGVLGRTRVGGYLTHAADEDARADHWRFGAQADLRVAGRPVAGRVEPIVSLGVGALQRADPRLPPEQLRQSLQGMAASQRPRTTLSLAPGVGIRLRLLPGVALRGDARRIIDFHDRPDPKLELSGGLSIGA